tara:strand:- start:3218 stop:3598 length:381 start_codon:yes stop_codon:yes gene_type:complete
MPNYLAKLCLVLIAAAILALPHGWCCAAPTKTVPADKIKAAPCCHSKYSENSPSETPQAPDHCRCCSDKYLTTTSKTNLDTHPSVALDTHHGPREVVSSVTGLLREPDAPLPRSHNLHVLLCVWIC